jgi:hypothetical protein
VLESWLSALFSGTQPSVGSGDSGKPTTAFARIPSFRLAGAFENTVNALYKHVVPKPKEQCSKSEQLGVSFAAGYIAGESRG